MPHRVLILVTTVFLLFNLKGITQMRFEPLQTDFGLSLVTDIYRDHEGFLWIANDGTGLMKHNSYNTVRYLFNKNDSNSISDDGIMDIEQDTAKNIWIATRYGLNRYIPKLDCFKRYYSNPKDTTSLSYNFVNRIYKDLYKNIWVLTTNGLCLYNPKEDNFTCYSLPTTSNNDFCSMAQDKSGNYWVVTTSSGIYHFDPQTGNFKLFLDKTIGADDLFKKKLFIDSDNKFWIANNGFGLAQFNPDSRKFSYFPINEDGSGINGNSVMDIIEWKDNYLLFAIDQGGINMLDKNSGKIVYIKSNTPLYGRLTSNGIYSFYIDNEDILWVGTSRGGISYYNKKVNRFKSYSRKDLSISIKDGEYALPLFNIISSFYEDINGNFWVGANGGGINLFNKEKLIFKSYVNNPLNKNSLSSNVVRTITGDLKGNLYIVTWDGGINKFDPKTGLFTKVHFERRLKGGYHGKNFWSAYIDSKNRFWIANPAGHIDLYNENKKLLKQFLIEQSAEMHNAPIICEDVQNNIYINRNDGVYKFNEISNEVKKIVDIKDVIVINADDPGLLWVGTLKDGLYQCSRSGNIIKHFTRENGLPDNYICGLVTINDEELWISTNNGLSKLNLKDESFTNYTKEEGLPGNQFYIQAFYKTKDNEIFFGGTNGYVSFYPKNIKKNPTLSQVFITNFYMNNQLVDFRDKSSPISTPIRYVKDIELSHSQNIIAFDFMAINYTFPLKNKYKYILEGFDTKWNETNAYAKTAVYTNLDPGKYVFKVIASNNDGLWNNVPKTIKITIRPAFWQTIFFRFLVIFLIVSTSVAFYFYRMYAIKKQKTELEKEVKKRTTDLFEANVELEEKKEEIELQSEILLKQNKELEMHKNHLEELVLERTGELEKAKNKAEESDKLKSAFLANISHEIRTPMNAILGFSALLEENNLKAEDRSRFIQIITKSGKSLLANIDEIIDLAKIQSGLTFISQTKFLVNDLLDELYETHGWKEDERNNPDIKFTYVPLNDQIFIKTDYKRFKQVINNLLSNAFKYTTRGSVKFGAKIKHNNILNIYVKDTGIGISKENQHKIFKRFSKIENKNIQLFRGIGLGLSISKQLANLLGGDIEVQSEFGQGSEFIFKLPINLEKVTSLNRIFKKEKTGK